MTLHFYLLHDYGVRHRPAAQTIAASSGPARGMSCPMSETEKGVWEVTALRRRAALGVLLLGAFMGVLDGFIVTVALRAIRADLGASFGQKQLIMAAYVVAYGVGLIASERLGCLYGRAAGRRGPGRLGLALISSIPTVAGLRPAGAEHGGVGAPPRAGRRRAGFTASPGCSCAAGLDRRSQEGQECCGS
jgi:hypothetical protein